MNNSNFVLQPLHPFGIEMVLSSHTLDALDPSQLRTLVQKHKIVLIRQITQLNKDQYAAYAERLGPLLEWDFGKVMEMRVHEEPKNYLFTESAVPFHWDGAFHTEPRFLLFHCIEAPDPGAGGQTLFTDTQRIWQVASDDEKNFWQQIKINYITEKLAHYGGNIHIPLVKTHPDTHETILRFAEPVPKPMLNPVDVSIENMSETERQLFLQNMTERCYAPENCYTHTWQTHDFLIADNHALIHARHAFTHFTRRHLRRIQVL